MRYDSWTMRLIRLLWPLSLYVLFGMLSMAGTGEFQYISSLLEKAAAACAFIGIFAKDSRVIRWPQKKMEVNDYFLLAAAGVCGAAGVNYLFQTIGLMNLLKSDYQIVTEALYGKTLVYETLVIAAAAPIAEEFLFRGLLYRRMRTYSRVIPAMIITSMIFAAFHGNVLQGLYGLFMGLLFAWVYEQYQSIKAPIVMHAAANIMSLIGTESAWVKDAMNRFPIITAAVGVGGLALSVTYIMMKMRDDSVPGTQMGEL